MPTTEFNEFVLTHMPTFIAINYQRLLKVQDPREQVEMILHIYNSGCEHSPSISSANISSAIAH